MEASTPRLDSESAATETFFQQQHMQQQQQQKQQQQQEAEGNDHIFSNGVTVGYTCLLYTSPSPRDMTISRMPSSA